MQELVSGKNVKEISESAKETAKRLIQLFADTISSLYDACAEYVKCIDADPSVKDAMLLEPNISLEHLNKFEEIGRKKRHQNLFLPSGLQYQALARCPLSEQEKYLSQPIPVLCVNGDVLNVSLENLTKEQVKQVFSGGSVRSIAGQKNYLEAEKTKEEPEQAKAPRPYRVTGYGLENITVKAISKAELLTILNKLKM